MDDSQDPSKSTDTHDAQGGQQPVWEFHSGKELVV